MSTPLYKCEFDVGSRCVLRVVDVASTPHKTRRARTRKCVFPLYNQCMRPSSGGRPYCDSRTAFPHSRRDVPKWFYDGLCAGGCGCLCFALFVLARPHCLDGWACIGARGCRTQDIFHAASAGIVLGELALVDAAYSGDWSRIGVISKGGWSGLVQCANAVGSAWPEARGLCRCRTAWQHSTQGRQAHEEMQAEMEEPHTLALCF